MTLYAVERIDDAASLTRSLLLPVSVWLWLKLAVVVAFVGVGSGGGGATSTASNVPSVGSSVGQFPGTTVDFGDLTLPEGALAVAGVVVAVLVVVGLVFAAVGAVMEFVLVTALRDREVRIRRSFRRHLRQGLGLFGFRLVLGAIAVGLIGGTAVGLFWSELSTVWAGGGLTVDAGSAVARGLLVAVVAVFVGIPVALLHGVTTEFVVPVMLATDRGVLAGWKRFWPVLTGDLAQYVVYLLIAFGLRIVTAIAAGLVLGVLAVLALIPFGVVALVIGVGALSGGSLSTATAIAFVALALAYVAVLVALAGVVYVPVRAFHRYHALLVLGDTDPEVDVIADLRPPISE